MGSSLDLFWGGSGFESTTLFLGVVGFSQHNFFFGGGGVVGLSPHLCFLGVGVFFFLILFFLGGGGGFTLFCVGSVFIFV